MKFYKSQTIAEGKAAIQVYENKFSHVEESEQAISFMAGRLANRMGEAKDWEGFEQYVAKIVDPATKAGVFNGLAWKMSGESIEGEATDLDRASKMSANSLKLVDQQLEDLPNGKPAYYTTKTWGRKPEVHLWNVCGYLCPLIV